MPLQDTRDGRDILRLFSGAQESLDRLRAAMAAAGVTAESPDRLDDEDEQLARMERQD